MSGLVIGQLDPGGTNYIACPFLSYLKFLGIHSCLLARSGATMGPDRFNVVIVEQRVRGQRAPRTSVQFFFMSSCQSTPDATSLLVHGLGLRDISIESHRATDGILWSVYCGATEPLFVLSRH